MVRGSMLPILLLVFTAALAGESLPSLECGGTVMSADDKTTDSLPRRNFAPGERRQDSRFCSQYTYGGWTDTMELHLGEGAAEYRDLVNQAVDLWNVALSGFNQRPVIEIIEHQAPRTLRLNEGFWSNRTGESEANLADDQSVIYFKPAGEDIGIGGFARLQTQGGRMVEADVYLNTRTEMQHGSVALTEPLLETSVGIIHALVDPLFVAVVHELGHALGLKHVPVSGNIMSYNYMPAMRDKWLASVELLEFALYATERESELEFLVHRSSLPPLVALSSEKDLYLRRVYTRSVGLGEQDRMALLCIYDFADWNH